MENIEPAIKTSFSQETRKKFLIISGVILGLISLFLLYIYVDYYQNKFLPKIYVDEIYISGLTKEEAKEKLESFYQESNLDLNKAELNIYYDDISSKKTLMDLGCQENFDEILEQSFAYGHQGKTLKRLTDIISSYWRIEDKYLKISCDQEKIRELINETKVAFDIEGASASAELVYSNNPNYISIFPGKNGRKLLSDESFETVLSRLNTDLVKIDAEDLDIEAVIASTSAELSEEKINQARERVLNFVGQEIVFEKDYQRHQINDQTLVSFLAFPDGIKNYSINEEKIDELSNTWKENIDQEAINAVFNYNPNNLVVSDFKDDEDGLILDKENLKSKIIETINEIEELASTKNSDEESSTEINKTWLYDLPVAVSPAEIELKDTNNLGINEIIGFGESWYYHSIPTRIHNVSITADRVDKIILKPGQSFSFNQSLGEVSEKTGYQSAYIIQDGQTKLAPGGGVCQVSSTLFRALLDAGLEVTRRLPHSYRVEYYEINNDPGFDATVYSGDTDLRFINDTDQHILLKFDANPANLYMTVKIYGTSDGRTTEINDYKKWGYASAPAPQYIPDPSLAPGQLKQIDWAASGIKAEFTNVIRDASGEIIREDYYYSSYSPWAAKYLQGV